MNKKSDSKIQRIQVFARCRPMNSTEKGLGSTSMMEVLPDMNRLVLKDRNTFREYKFDQVFPADSEQITVYQAVVAPLIQEVLLGYSCTVFAYGQTGTGKTYTMEGERTDAKCSWKDEPSAGIIPRALHQIYEELNKAENVEFSVRVSFYEIYNEEVYDLLSSSDFTKLRLYEDSSVKDSVKIKNLEEVLVKSRDEVYRILEIGAAKRHTAETKLNACSSRSHTIFTVKVDITEKTSSGGTMEKSGKLNLVDLAGSENVGRSGAVDKRAREAGNINQSLLTLGRVITALIEKQAHVPYRESKLTRILQYSLGGHAKTSIIATVSPALCNLDETISTLEYAAKAKTIDINPELNRRMLRKGLIKELTRENERLRIENEGLEKDLVAARSNQGFFVDAENYESKIQQITLMDKEIKTLQAENVKLHQEAVIAANDIKELQAKIRRTQTVVYTNEDICDSLRVLSQKQCAGLYDMVADYNKERIKFSNWFKEDQDRLENELSEHRKKTNCLREKLSKELQLLLGSVVKHFDEQASCERQRANDLSQDLKSVKYTWVSEFDSFLSRRLPSLLNDLNAENVLIEDWITNVYMNMKEKVNQHTHVLKNQSLEGKKQLDLFKDLLESYFMNHDAAILHYDSKIQSISKHQEKMNNIYNNFVMMYGEMNEKMNESVQFENISKFEDNANHLRAVQAPLDALYRLNRTTEQEMAQFSDISDDIKHEEFFQKLRSNMPLCSKLTTLLDDLKKSQIDNYEKTSAKIEASISEALANVQNNNCLVNEITTISNKIDEEFLEDKLGIQVDILSHLGEVFVESEISYTKAALQLQGAILEKDADLEKFISEAFVKDIPTGATPQPKAFQSPRHSRTTSPYHRFLNGFHVKNIVDSPLKEIDESICTDGSSFFNSQDISLASDVYDSDGCESDSPMEPETHFDDKDLESDKENKEVSRLSRWKSVRFSEPTAMDTEQHLKASPLGSCNNTNCEVGTD